MGSQCWHHRLYQFVVGPGDKTDSNFAKLLASPATLESTTGSYFASAIYIENNAPALQGTMNMVNALQYVIAHYVNELHYFHWHGKPVISSPLLSWVMAYAIDVCFIRSQVDPQNQEICASGGNRSQRVICVRRHSSLQCRLLGHLAW